MKGMGMMPARSRKPMSEINVVPYIDVMLVLPVSYTHLTLPTNREV